MSEKQKFLVCVAKGVDSVKFAHQLEDRGVEIVSVMDNIGVVVINVEQERLPELSTLPEVKVIEENGPRYKLC